MRNKVPKMKKNMAASREGYTMGALIAQQEKAVLMAMEIGSKYTVRQLAQLSGLGVGAVDRTITGLKRTGDVEPAGALLCPVADQYVDSVRLSLADGA